MKKVTNDHRTRVTKMLIRRAFLELLRQKPLAAISVKELCELAGIHRGTFYTHYEDTYDLLHQLEEEMLTDFQAALAPLLEAEPFDPVKVNIGIFRCLQENSDLCTVTLGDYGDKRFARRLLSLGREKCMEAYLRYFHGATPRQVEYYYAFVSEGCIGLLRKWLDDGMRESAEEIAHIAEEIMLYGLALFEQSDRKREG